MMCTVRVTIKLHEAHKVFNLSHVQAHDTARLILVDSVAGGTVICDASCFSVIKPPVQDVSIMFGVGPRIPVSGIGTVVLKVPSMDSGAMHTVCIKGAYYVPDQPLNILSVHDVLSI
jgi:hypothetical protein